ncbi:LLM class flavin-dependent oxidoreductase [Dietzia sp. B19]|uniref:LLM class flavin-dependent oxidoreductase n=1 Tax=Dietzia sp. B19 TaxID=1630632 RepID=UPI0015F9BB09|nr:LLM class flavin-dependent oxidoreductase [Dietzia sp. B19]MBB1056551.1 LLM class flavin-dependent oxidoreductase [Dietzia sp. B19]
MPHTTHSVASHFTVGVALDGAGVHPAAWREHDADPHTLFAPDHWQRLIGVLDDAGADYVSVDDSLALQHVGLHREPHGPESFGTAAPYPFTDRVAGRLDALLLLSWIAPLTHSIGLIPTVTTTHTEPFHVATALQTLDHVSAGRAGWQLRISPSEAESTAFGRRAAPDVDTAAVLAGDDDAGLNELLAEAADVAEVASRLWDSWEDNAIIRDTHTGRFLDRDQLHHVRFESERFSIAGPSIVPRSPQGRPPVTLLAHSDAVYRLAAEAADVVFVTPEPQSARGGASYGRTAAEIVAAVRKAEDTAARGRTEGLEGEQRQGGLAPLRIVADLIVAFDGASVTGAPETGAAVTKATETGAARIARLDAVGPRLEGDARVATGTAAQIADVIAEWRDVGIEGIRLRPLAQPFDVRVIADELLPELRRRGLANIVSHSASASASASDSDSVHDVESQGTQLSLRERFGLGAALNRYAANAANATNAAAQHQEVAA